MRMAVKVRTFMVGLVSGMLLGSSVGFAGAALAQVAVVKTDGVTAPVDVLSLEEAMRLALQSHPTVQVRQSAVAAAAAELEGSKWKRYPSVTISAGQAVSGSDPGNSLVLTQPLWTAGRITGEIEGRKAQFDATGMSLLEAEQELLQRVAQIYNELLRLGERLRVVELNVVEHERLHGIIRRRFERDVGAAVDLSLADARLQQARLDQMLLVSQRASTLSSLEQLIGRPVGELSLPALGSLPWRQAQDVIQAMLDHSPALKRLQAELAFSQSQMLTARSTLWPQVSLRVQRSSSGAGALSGSTRSYVFMEYQTGSGLSAVSGLEAAAFRLGAARAAIDAATLEIRDLGANRFNEALVAAQVVEPTRSNAQANAEVVASYLRQFAAGRKSWQEVMNAQREWVQTMQAVADAEANARLGLLRLQILTGNLSSAALVSKARPGF